MSACRLENELFLLRDGEIIKACDLDGPMRRILIQNSPTEQNQLPVLGLNHQCSDALSGSVCGSDQMFWILGSGLRLSPDNTPLGSGQSGWLVSPW